MRYGNDYGPRHRGRAPETNWMGRNYRSPGERRPRGYDAAFGAGYQPGHGGWNVERGAPRGYDRPAAPLGHRYEAYDRPYRGRAGYDRPDHHRARGGYDRGYQPVAYDRGYREMGAMERGHVLDDPWGPYGDFRQMQRRAGWVQDRPWPNRYFTDHGHHMGPY